jgi:hypothetical protein
MPAKLDKPLVLDGFPLGMDTRSRIDKMPVGSARLIQDADVTNSGNIVFPRPGYATVDGAAGGHSLWTHPALNFALYNAAGTLTSINKNSKARSTVRAGIDTTQEISYAQIAGRAYWTNGEDMGYVDALEDDYLWGGNPPPAPILTASNTGDQLAAGRYIVAYTASYNDGEETPASNSTLITLATAGTITVSPIPTSAAITHINLYMSSTDAPDGDQLYYHSRVTAGTSSTILTKSDLLRPLRTQHMARFPVCSYICAWKRHILGVRVNELVWSSPFQLSLWDENKGGVSFDEPITFVAPVDDGVYVGTASQTAFLSGTNPEAWQRLKVYSHGIIPQKTMCWLPNDTFVGELPATGPAVPWANTEGNIVIGRSGGIVQPVAQNLAIQNHESSRFQFFERNGLRKLLVTLKQPLGSNNRQSPDITPGTINQFGITIN